MITRYSCDVTTFKCTYFSANKLKSPNKSPTRMPVRLALLAYAGPMPFFVVPKDLPVLAFSASWSPSTCWWKSNTKCARSETINRFCQSVKPFFSFFSISSNKPGTWTTTPLPKIYHDKQRLQQKIQGKRERSNILYLTAKLLLTTEDLWINGWFLLTDNRNAFWISHSAGQQVEIVFGALNDNGMASIVTTL